VTAVHIVAPARAELGECPLWAPDEHALYWVDIEGHEIHRFDPATGVDEVRVLPGRPGALARTRHRGRLLVAIEAEIIRFAGLPERPVEETPPIEETVPGPEANPSESEGN